MLKKLVKYGNSNALVIDKAILELLNIEEGSVVKIKTDGKDIIISPQEKITTEKINIPLTSNQATKEALVEQMFKYYKNIDASTKEKLEKKYIDLLQRQECLAIQMQNNPNFKKFQKEVTESSKAINIDSNFAINHKNLDDYNKIYTTLLNKFYPDITAEMSNLTERIKNFTTENNLTYTNEKQSISNMDEKHKENMHSDYFDAFKKHGNSLQTNLIELQNNPEYQHEAQLLAEKYSNNKNSDDYLREFNELTGKYIPDYLKLQEELKTISKKYSGDTEQINKNFEN